MLPFVTIYGLLVSLIGGGLAGGCVSLYFHRKWDLRAKRTTLYPLVNSIYSAYVIRMEKPEGRYWVTIVGQNPKSEDVEFVDHRSNFISDLVQYNELKEARLLRKQMLDNAMQGEHTPGLITKVDLSPELKALDTCLNLLHNRLGL
jgi:hypothetical protein